MTDEEFDNRAEALDKIDDLIRQAQSIVVIGSPIFFDRRQRLWFGAMIDMFDQWHDACLDTWGDESDG